MYYLENAGLRVAVLDPESDVARLGSRYCAGGYIWQVTDNAKGELLSGPVYPEPNPPGFHGQGLPEAFEIALGQDRAQVGEEVWVVGVGRVERDSPVKPFHVRNNFKVVEFATWTVESETTTVLRMGSRQKFRDWDADLVRTVSLEGRTLVSTTTVKNQGAGELPLRWFAHPFFPNAGTAGFRFSTECSFPNYLSEGGGFACDAEGRITRKAGFDWKAGCYQLLLLPFGYPLDVYQSHPALGEVKVECRFAVAWMPIWGNDHTLSCEPYFHSVLPPGMATEWSIRYGF